MKTDIFLTAAQVAGLTGIDAQCLRSHARAHPETLGFPASVIGNRVRFPTKKFCDFTGITEEQLQAMLNEDAPNREAANA